MRCFYRNRLFISLLIEQGGIYSLYRNCTNAFFLQRFKVYQTRSDSYHGALLFRLRLRYPERMCFGIKNVVVQADEIWFAEDQIEILERFGHPEALYIC